MKNMIHSFSLNLVLVAYIHAVPILGEWQDGELYGFNHWNNVGVSTPNLADVNSHTIASLPPAILDVDYGSGDGILVGTNPNAIRISGGGTSGSEMFYTTAFGNLDLTTYAGFSFDFYTEYNDPIQMGFYFRSVDTLWYYVMDYVTENSWNTYSSSFSYTQDWMGFSISNDSYSLIDLNVSSEFNNSLAVVSEIGFFIDYTSAANGIYGVDDFGLTVPEPEVYLTVLVALLTFAVIYKKFIVDWDAP